MSIRLLSSTEMNIVQQLAYTIWPETFKDILSQEQISYMLDWMYNLDSLEKQVSDGHLFYLYSENEIPLGFIGLELNSPKNNVVKIHKLYVIPQTQGKGIGKKLIDKAKDIATINGIRTISLNVNRFNKAVSFYQHLGFKISSEENINIGNDFLMEDYVLDLEIEKESF